MCGLGLAVSACTAAAPDFDEPGSVEDLAVGIDFTCALLEGGRTYCWGGNDVGQLGDGSPGDARGEPRRVVELEGAAALALAGSAACAVLDTGEARCWGSNQPERFGDDAGFDVEPRPRGLNLGGASLGPVLEVAQSNTHLCLRTDSQVLCAGLNSHHQLGRETGEPTTALLAPVEGLPPGRRPTSIAAGVSSGSGFTLVALDDGSVHCVGSNDDRECAQPGAAAVTSLTPIAELEGVVQVVAGGEFACALDAAGQVRCWGSSRGGRNGSGVDDGPDLERPMVVSGLPAIRRLAAGQSAVIGVSEDGSEVWAWGANDHGMFGPAEEGAALAPVAVRVIAGAEFEAEISPTHVCLLERRPGAPDVILCAGRNAELALGTGSPVARDFTPVLGIP